MLYSKYSGYWKSFCTCNTNIQTVQRTLLSLTIVSLSISDNNMSSYASFFTPNFHGFISYVFMRHSENRISSKCFCVCCRSLIYEGIFHCLRRLSLQYKSCVWVNGLLKGSGEKQGYPKLASFLENSVTCYSTSGMIRGQETVIRTWNFGTMD